MYCNEQSHPVIPPPPFSFQQLTHTLNHKLIIWGYFLDDLSPCSLSLGVGIIFVQIK
jgi:hypothetical protein